jgi:bifunctional UDP-N-acetylglucosamine pyrophosphorylase/glucosamine-1-phosphate N-acetyltransferase
VESGAHISGPVWVEKGALVRSGAYIEGPVYIGSGARVGPNCYIRPCTSIGENCHIGAAVEIKNSVMMNGSNAPHHNYVGDSVIGERCNLGAGTKVANLRLDGKPVKSYMRCKRVSTGRRKLGVIMGSDVKVGINASIDPGTVVGNDVFIGPGARIRGMIRDGAVIL